MEFSSRVSDEKIMPLSVLVHVLQSVALLNSFQFGYPSKLLHHLLVAAEKMTI